MNDMRLRSWQGLEDGSDCCCELLKVYFFFVNEEEIYLPAY